MRIEEFFAAHPRAALAFSGGTDSAYLLYEAVRCGADIGAYFIKTELQPQFELRDAERLANGLGVSLRVIEASVLSDESVASNPADRCYHCKKRLFSLLAESARRDGYDLIIDGTNASDLSSDRPGMRALSELGVLSPLRECGLTKAEIRERSRAAGLFTADKPAYACLATRIATGERLTAEKLCRIEAAERALFALGFSDFRVRLVGNTAKLQLPEGQIDRAVGLRASILRAVGDGFDAVTLDLRGR